MHITCIMSYSVNVINNISRVFEKSQVTAPYAFSSFLSAPVQQISTFFLPNSAAV